METVEAMLRELVDFFNKKYQNKSLSTLIWYLLRVTS